MAKRYDQMLALIDTVKPRQIVEVGVHRAMRAAMLCRAALQYHPVTYVGYDVFDTMGPAFQEAALNGKGEPTEREARRRLDAVDGKFTYALVIGDTRDTLHPNSVLADFAFIDGDHRVEAIRGDYLALAETPCVVFDDYFMPDAQGNMPDTALYGANRIVDEAREAGRRVEILPAADACKCGGVSHLAVVWRD